MLPAFPASADSPAGDRTTAASTDAATGMRPRLDVDGDGIGDLLYRDVEGQLWATESLWDSSGYYGIRSQDRSERPKELLTPGDLDGNGEDEILTLSASGTLALYESAGERTGTTGKVLWSGTGWQKYNKVSAPGDLNG
ncbi:hypothetical protein SAMN05216483_6287 [Streptomyces sp. 2131.1]|uniref:hypothetical protein n=1 Tax=Streptomyces sp. 2131.1 TaxID=1855346 RepID=UPI000896F55D|nr:hypothetical protein [Streptomyces sp. 2131.1]SEE46022.1 hypothetical protein SAMN05216483_6287 [Streptomyces sp. 2131.1]